jgi:hypothetical protein
VVVSRESTVPFIISTLPFTQAPAAILIIVIVAVVIAVNRVHNFFIVFFVIIIVICISLARKLSSTFI